MYSLLFRVNFFLIPNFCLIFKQVDASLSFLDGFVAEGLSRGAAPYKPPHQRQEEKLSQEKGSFPLIYNKLDGRDIIFYAVDILVM
jgi:hypothetical protein